MNLLIDAEVYLYRAATGAEFEAEWDDGDWTYLCRHDEAKATFQDQINAFQEVVPDHQPVLVFGERWSFRYGIWPGYKANRRKYRRPAGYHDLMKWAWFVAPTRGWEVQRLPDVEGDDVLGVLYEMGDVIASVDKDLLTIPGLHLRDGEIKEVNRLQADLAFYAQVLTGDSADNYPGCPGVGAVGAERALAGCTTELEMWQAVVEQYEKKQLDEAYAIKQARCARILRRGEYNMETKAPLLWSPPVA